MDVITVLAQFYSSPSMLNLAFYQVQVDALGRVVVLYTHTTVILVLVFY